MGAFIFSFYIPSKVEISTDLEHSEFLVRKGCFKNFNNLLFINATLNFLIIVFHFKAQMAHGLNVIRKVWCGKLEATRKSEEVRS